MDGLTEALPTIPSPLCGRGFNLKSYFFHTARLQNVNNNFVN
jgi:hypothetical protein